jgi:hypothetical protein
MPVSDRDKQYFARIGAIKERAHAQAAADHLALSLDERLARSWALYCANRHTANVAAREDDPAAFYERARQLGLYRE